MCTKPSLNIDNSCGSSFHRAPAVIVNNKSRSISLRTTAASISSKFAGSSASVPISDYLVPEEKSDPVRWQKIVEDQIEFDFRETIAVCQSLAPTASVFISEVLLCLTRSAREIEAYGSQLIKAGFLIGWESLVSTHGKEMCM